MIEGGLNRHELLSEELVSAMFSKQSGDGKDPEGSVAVINGG